jgi:hypothetical protein
VGDRDERGEVARDPLGHQEPGGELHVVPRCAHGDGERRAVEPDLERLLDHDLVAARLARAGAQREDVEGGAARVRSHGAG